MYNKKMLTLAEVPSPTVKLGVLGDVMRICFRILCSKEVLALQGESSPHLILVWPRCPRYLCHCPS